VAVSNIKPSIAGIFIIFSPEVWIVEAMVVSGAMDVSAASADVVSSTVIVLEDVSFSNGVEFLQEEKIKIKDIINKIINSFLIIIYYFLFL